MHHEVHVYMSTVQAGTCVHVHGLCISCYMCKYFLHQLVHLYISFCIVRYMTSSTSAGICIHILCIHELAHVSYPLYQLIHYMCICKLILYVLYISWHMYIHLYQLIHDIPLHKLAHVYISSVQSYSVLYAGVDATTTDLQCNVCRCRCMYMCNYHTPTVFCMKSI